MKKLALAVATLFLAATPAFACPDMESGETKDHAPRTAEKDKAKAKDAKGQEKAKPAPKKEAPKTAKPNTKPAPKTNDKVSAK
jgi:hypothetical protein